MIKKLQKHFNNLSSIQNNCKRSKSNIVVFGVCLGKNLSSDIEEDSFQREISNGYKTSFCVILSDVYIYSQFCIYVAGEKC